MCNLYNPHNPVDLERLMRMRAWSEGMQRGLAVIDVRKDQFGRWLPVIIGQSSIPIVRNSGKDTRNAKA